MNRMTSWIVTVAAAAATFALGWGLGGARAVPPKEVPMSPQTTAAEAKPSPAVPGSQFALLLLEDHRYQAPGDAASGAARVREYGDWARSIAASGRFVDGAKLSDDGRLLRKSGETLDVEPGPAGGRLGVLAGYFLIGAESYEEALRLAGECPHAKYGGTIEVRRIDT